jgi:signal transduction histidine kinase/DNA-binding response OmpR family regulator
MFRFAAPLHPDAEILTYRYRLHSTDHWQEIGNSHELRFSNLPPDDYQLEITTDEINSFSRLSLPFTIRAPWYWSWWSKIVYVSVILGIAYLFYRFQLRRRLAEAEATQLKQLDHFKTQFYTNITHEFRTPITVIQGLVSKLNIKKYKTDLAIIKNNSNQLLHLVNQFLSLSKLEAGVMQVNLTQQDVIAFSRYLVESMRSLAEQKEITLRFESDLEELTMDIDADKWQHILVNLLSNAIKFTPEGGEVVITIQRVEQQLLMEVSDTGIGISYKDQMKIFDRFYQVKKEQVLSVGGSGIGLAICKEMVELLDGTIEVESALNKGSVFCIALPIRQEAPLASSVLKSEEQQTHRSLDQELAAINLLAEEEATILLVEDNADVLYYIMKTLRRKYQIITAKDGQEGFSMAKEQLPDLIISDIMMPFMNGYELCYRLKKEETTQHLPVILLTAKADQSSRIEGLKYGADAYLMKPFDEIELILRIEKLLEKQRRMQAYYQSRYLTVPPTPIQFHLGEEYDFIKQCTAIIEASLQAKWNAASLAEKLNVGEHTFRRKIKQLSGFPVTIFVRRLRLKRAHELITTSDDSLKNIAYQVGFGSPNELSNYFKEVFGQSPSELRD